MPIEKIEPGSPESESADLAAENLARLKILFPDVVTEGPAGPAIDVDVLKALVGDATAIGHEEKYGLNWHGKRAARQLALAPSAATLRPMPDQSVDWQTTRNLVIEGDNLEVLKLLQKSYAGKVKLIYIDPPYNTGKDFIYPDNFRNNIGNYLELTQQVEGGRKISSNTENSGRFHTDWLNMLYPRLQLARNLLTDDGVIFVSLDDTEAANAQHILTEIFGEENFRANISWQKRYTRSNNTVDFTTVVEHIFVYSKTESFVVNLLDRTKEADARYTNPDNDSRGPWKGASILNPASPSQRPNLCYPIVNPNTGSVTTPTTNAWRRSKEDYDRLSNDGRLYWGIDGKQNLPAIKMFLSEAREITPINFWDHVFAGNTDDGTKDLRKVIGEKVFDNPKPIQLIERVIEHGAEKDSIILDFFAGSGTTAHAVLRKNASDNGRRRFISVQLPEPIDANTSGVAAEFCKDINRPSNIAEISKERIRRAGLQIKGENPLFPIDCGFKVFSLDTSSIRPWNTDPSSLEENIWSSLDNILPGRTEEDVLSELMLKLGLDLASPIERKRFSGIEVSSIGSGVLFACLATPIRSESIEDLALGIMAWWRQLSPAGPSTVIFRDDAFGDDVAKLNLVSILEQAGLKSIRTI